MMRKTWTITVDIQDNEFTSHEDNADEMDYWDQHIENAIAGVMRDYHIQNERLSEQLEYGAIDFTNISVKREDSGDLTND